MYKSPLQFLLTITYSFLIQIGSHPLRRTKNILNFICKLRILLISCRRGSKLYQEVINVCNQELIVVEIYMSSYHINMWIITVSTNLYIIDIILPRTVLLTSKQMYVYCILCIAVCFNEILVWALLGWRQCRNV